MEEAEKLCNKVAIIDFGKIVVLDSPENLKKKVGGGIIKIKPNHKTNLKNLSKLKFVKRIDSHDGMINLKVKDAERKLPQILRAVGDVESVELHSTTLNEVFLYFTGREIREEAGEGGVFERISRLRR